MTQKILSSELNALRQRYMELTQSGSFSKAKQLRRDIAELVFALDDVPSAPFVIERAKPARIKAAPFDIPSGRWFVYVVSEAVLNDYGQSCVKIGFTNNPILRLSQLKVGNPRELTVVALFGGPTRAWAKEVESIAHRLCDNKIHYREWFICAPEIAVNAVQLSTTVHADGQRARDFERPEDINIELAGCA